MKKYRCAILLAVVGPLPIELRRIVVLPKDVQEIAIRDLIRVKCNLYNFRVPSLIRADVLIRGILQVSTHVTHGRRGDAGNFTERRLDSPETPCSKSRLFRCHDEPPPSLVCGSGLDVNRGGGINLSPRL